MIWMNGRENVGTERNSWSQLFKDNGHYTARVSIVYHMGIPIDIEKGSNGTDDEDAGSGMELFDMEYDPKQYNNLAHNPRCEEMVGD